MPWRGWRRPANSSRRRCSARPGRAAREIDAAALYSLAARLGLDYGGRFRTVRRIELLGPGTRGDATAEAAVQLDPSVIDETLAPYIIHPALLDGALQGLLALIADRQAGHSGDLAGASFLPWRFGRVRAPAPFGRVPHSARLRVTRVGTRSAAADIALFDEAGGIVAELSDCWFRRVELTRRAALDEAALRVDLVPAPLREDAAPAVLAAIADILRPLAAISDAAAAAQAEQKLLLEALIASVGARGAAGRCRCRNPVHDRRDRRERRDRRRCRAAFRNACSACCERFGAASQADRVWTIHGQNDLPAVSEVWRLLLAEQPELVSELALIAAAAAELPGLLAAGRAAARPRRRR